MKLSPLYYLDLLNVAQQGRGTSPLEFLALWIATVLPWAITLVATLLLVAHALMESNGSSVVHTGTLAMIVLPALMPYGYVGTRLLLHRRRLLCFTPWQQFHRIPN